ncbi:hypothetical protein ONZ45_g9049 [Pleurotus djamor]|nr:hypothetical protein ONZ45_g9049 [Pleurotus djamor]
MLKFLIPTILFVSLSPSRPLLLLVKASVDNIVNKIEIFDTAMTEFPTTGATLKQGYYIHSSAMDLVKTVNSTDTLVKATGQLSQKDSRDILNSFKGAEKYIKSAIATLIEKKAAFKALPANTGDLAPYDLNQLDISVGKLADSFLNVFDSAVKKDTSTFKGHLHSELQDAITQFKAP